MAASKSLTPGMKDVLIAKLRGHCVANYFTGTNASAKASTTMCALQRRGLLDTHYQLTNEGMEIAMGLDEKLRDNMEKS